MSFMDWFKKAKDAKAAAQDKEPANNEFGNQGAGSQAYKDAQAALDEENGKKKDKTGGQYASND